MGSVAVTCGVFSLLSFVSTVAQGEAACVSGRVYFASQGEVGRTLSEFGSRLVAVGRVDSVTAKRGVEVLGQFVQPAAGDSYQAGDYAAVIDWTTKNSVGRILEVRPIASRYVPGASEIYLKSAVKSADTSHGQLRAGKVVVDYLASSIGVDFASTLQGSVISVFGTQPGPRGVVLGNCVALARTLVKALSSDPLGGRIPDGYSVQVPMVHLAPVGPMARSVLVVLTVHWAPVARMVR